MSSVVSVRTLGLVVAGGAVGVLAREMLLLPVDARGLPWATLAINIAGSLLLGIVVGWLDDRHPRARAFLGTGVMGGFTTYSAFAVASAGFVGAEPAVFGLAASLVAASVLGGVLAAFVGLVIGRRVADVPGELEDPEDAR
ncbi:CrcB family protein [Microbacterium sp. NPDC077184]|uniref:fluoride efflux transporter FluC n=1 Tax=Microbacterium sp. NPDC077184 TaxID=3154764 RepID=UPI00341C9469